MLTSVSFTPSASTFLISSMAASWERAFKLYLVLERNTKNDDQVATKQPGLKVRALGLYNNLCNMALEMSLGERISVFHPNRSDAVLIPPNSFSLCSSDSVLESTKVNCWLQECALIGAHWRTDLQLLAFVRLPFLQLDRSRLHKPWVLQTRRLPSTGVRAHRSKEVNYSSRAGWKEVVYAENQ